MYHYHKIFENDMQIFRSKPKKPPQYKNYPLSKVIKLPKPTHLGIPLEEAIEKRRFGLEQEILSVFVTLWLL